MSESSSDTQRAPWSDGETPSGDNDNETTDLTMPDVQDDGTIFKTPASSSPHQTSNPSPQVFVASYMMADNTTHLIKSTFSVWPQKAHEHLYKKLDGHTEEEMTRKMNVVFGLPKEVFEVETKTTLSRTRSLRLPYRAKQTPSPLRYRADIPTDNITPHDFIALHMDRLEPCLPCKREGRAYFMTLIYLWCLDMTRETMAKTLPSLLGLRDDFFEHTEKKRKRTPNTRSISLRAFVTGPRRSFAQSSSAGVPPQARDSSLNTSYSASNMKGGIEEHIPKDLIFLVKISEVHGILHHSYAEDLTPARGPRDQGDGPADISPEDFINLHWHDKIVTVFDGVSLDVCTGLLKIFCSLSKGKTEKQMAKALVSLLELPEDTFTTKYDQPRTSNNQETPTRSPRDRNNAPASVPESSKGAFTPKYAGQPRTSNNRETPRGPQANITPEAFVAMHSDKVNNALSKCGPSLRDFILEDCYTSTRGESQRSAGQPRTSNFEETLGSIFRRTSASIDERDQNTLTRPSTGMSPHAFTNLHLDVIEPAVRQRYAKIGMPITDCRAMKDAMYTLQVELEGLSTRKCEEKLIRSLSLPKDAFRAKTKPKSMSPQELIAQHSDIIEPAVQKMYVGLGARIMEKTLINCLSLPRDAFAVKRTPLPQSRASDNREMTASTSQAAAPARFLRTPVDFVACHFGKVKSVLDRRGFDKAAQEIELTEIYYQLEGLSMEAMERALAERFDLPVDTFMPGQRGPFIDSRKIPLKLERDPFSSGREDFCGAVPPGGSLPLDGGNAPFPDLSRRDPPGGPLMIAKTRRPLVRTIVYPMIMLTLLGCIWSYKTWSRS